MRRVWTGMVGIAFVAAVTARGGWARRPAMVVARAGFGR